MKDSETVEKAIEHLEDCMIETPRFIKGIIVTDYSLIDKALNIAVKAIKDRDEYMSNIIESGKRAGESTDFFVKSVLEGKIILNPDGKKRE